MTIPQDILKEAERKYPYTEKSRFNQNDLGAYNLSCMEIDEIRQAYAEGVWKERQKLQQAVKPSTHVTP
jgi:hypothetical protein